MIDLKSRQTKNLYIAELDQPPAYMRQYKWHHLHHHIKTEAAKAGLLQQRTKATWTHESNTDKHHKNGRRAVLVSRGAMHLATRWQSIGKEHRVVGHIVHAKSWQPDRREERLRPQILTCASILVLQSSSFRRRRKGRRMRSVDMHAPATDGWMDGRSSFDRTRHGSFSCS
jgi:hypothetical protein